MLVSSLRNGASIETNVLALLPIAEQNKVIAQSVKRVNDENTQKHFLLVGGSSREQVVAASQALHQTLLNSRVFPSIVYRIDQNQLANPFDIYTPYKNNLLSQDIRRALQEQGLESVTQAALKKLYSPVSLVNSSVLAEDPLLLFFDFLMNIPSNSGAFKVRDNILSIDFEGRHYVLLSLVLPGSPFSLAVQEQVVSLLNEETQRLVNQFPGADIISLGGVNYARAGVESARGEIATIGMVSLVGVILLMLIIFRSPLPMLVSLLPIGVGFAAAVSVCLTVFGSVHLLTLVFGASLIGISIDYSFHFFSDRLVFGEKWQPQTGIKRIYSGITLGLVTSIVGFAGLCFAPFPGMQQMALFSAVGLLAAYLTVLWIFPALAPRPSSVATRWPLLVERGFSKWLVFYAQIIRWPVILLFIGFLIAGWRQLEANDDMRILQAAPERLQQEEERFRAITGSKISNRFFLVQAESPQALLEQEELLTDHLWQLKNTDAIAGFDAVSNYVPSVQRQRQNFKLVKTALSEQIDLLDMYAENTGMDKKPITSFYQQFQTEPTSFLLLENWLKTPSAKPYHHLWLGVSRASEMSENKHPLYTSVVALHGINDMAQLITLEQTWPQVYLIDQVEDISHLFKRYRERASWLVLLSYGIIFLALCVRYGYKRRAGARRAVAVMLPPVTAALFTLAVLGWLGEAINLFHSLALLLVLGIGIDYTLFLEEARDHQTATLLAVVLSAFTTMLSFGLLSLSDVAAIHAFGITVLVGIICALLLSPSVIANDLNEKKK